MKNHEGYHDPTAGEAVRKVHQRQKQKHKRELRLYYRIGEVKSFRSIYRNEKIQSIYWN